MTAKGIMTSGHFFFMVMDISYFQLPLEREFYLVGKVGNMVDFGALFFDHTTRKVFPERKVLVPYWISSSRFLK